MKGRTKYQFFALLLVSGLFLAEIFGETGKTEGHWGRIISKLTPLHKEMPPPRPGEWLYLYREPGQSFQQYRDSDPLLPTEERNTLYIQPLGIQSNEYNSIVKICSEYLSIFFNIETKLEGNLKLGKVPKGSTRKNILSGTQLSTLYLNNEVLYPRLKRSAFGLVGFTQIDLWPGNDWNFVFGEAYLKKRIGVWSLKRMGSPDLKDRGRTSCLVRTLKLASHEVAHMFTIEHCIAKMCNLNGSNSLRELDSQPLHLCPDCMSKVCYATKISPVSRYRKLEAFFKKYRIRSQERFYTESIKVLKGE